jgi:DNA-binding beta-propeller fold protein YncE
MIRKSAALAAVCAAALQASPSAADDAASAEVAGLAVEMLVTAAESGAQSIPRAGEQARVEFRVRDARSGQPIAGLHPLAWMLRTDQTEALGEAECRDRVRPLVDGGLASRPDADLNRYLLLALNDDRSISFINPQVAFSRTQLESLIVLPGVGTDWVLSRDGDSLYVSMAEADSVAVIDTRTRRLRTVLQTGGGSRPGRLALAPGSGAVYVDLAGASAVAVIKGDEQAGRIGTHAGEHRFAFTPDGATAFVASAEARSVAIIDTASLSQRASVDLGGASVAIAYGPASGLVYVALDEGGIAAIDPGTGHVVANMPAPPGAAALRFDPQGRFALLANPAKGTLSLLDSAVNRLTATASVQAGADQIAFSRGYAYVRGRASADFALLELDQLRQGRIEPVSIRAEQGASAPAGDTDAVADMTAPTPDGAGAMLASAAGRTIYGYAEGMMAPAGTLNAYGHRLRGLLVLDRSLTETAPGTYATTVRVSRSGHFDVPVLIDRPRLIHCFRTEIAPSEAAGQQVGRASLRIERLYADTALTPGIASRVAVRIADAATGEPVLGLADVRALAFEPPGTWQQRQRARDTGEGIYAAEWVFPRPGVYDVSLSIPSRGIGFAHLPALHLTVGAQQQQQPGEGR